MSKKSGTASPQELAILLEKRRALTNEINVLRKVGVVGEVKPQLRKKARERTRVLVLDAARAIWAEPGSYETGDIRSIAKSIGRSTGSVFAHFNSKADLWRAAMGYEPPVDCVEVREILKASAARRSGPA